MTHKISPSSIVAGLTTLDRSTLATFLAVFEDSRAVSLLSDKIGAFKDDAAGKYAAWKDRTTAETRERFSVRVQETATRIESSDVSDDALRICLWAHIRESFGLLPRIAVSPSFGSNSPGRWQDIDFCTLCSIRPSVCAACLGCDSRMDCQKFDEEYSPGLRGYGFRAARNTWRRNQES